MKKKTILFATLFASTLLWTGCSDDSNVLDTPPTEEGQPDEEDPDTEKLRAIVVSEGQFGYGTSSLTSLSSWGNVEQDLFRKVNDRPMGDVAQSMTRIGDYYYVPLNNSRKIEVFEVDTYKSVETMSIGLNNMIPMYVTHLGGDSVFVTNQKSNGEVVIMDINHGTERTFIKNKFKLNYRSFQSCVVNKKLFVGGDNFWIFDVNNVTQSGFRRLYYQTEKLPSGNGRLVQLVDFSKLPVDKHNRIWALTWFLDSDTYKDRNYLICIDPETEQTVHEIDITSLKINSVVGCIDISPDLSTIYFNARRTIYSVNVDNPQTPTLPLFSVELTDDEVAAGRNNKTVYHMAVSKENTVFLSEVLYGSIERSDIYEYNPTTGEEMQKFEAGIFSHHIYFK
ncbi:MAG: hypothetical protein ACRC3Z_05250 [Phocaeicola sp.]